MIILLQGISDRQEKAKSMGQTPPEFKVTTQFLELYNEEVHDLFDNSATGARGTKGKSGIKIHEDGLSLIHI